MPALSTEDQGKVRYHLNYRTGVTDSGVMAWLIESMNTIYDTYAVTRIGLLIARCEEAELETKTGGQDTGNTSFNLAAKEIYDGDLTRTRVQLREKTLKERWENYYVECDNLAETLHVPNLRRQGQAEMHSHLITGGAYIKAIPGPTDTCVSDKLFMRERYV